jgi:hypothetical protein
MNLRELEAQADFLAPVIAAAVKKAVEPLKEQIAEREDRIAELTKGMKNLEDEMQSVKTPGFHGALELVDMDALIKTIVDLVPKPQDGKDAEPVDLEALAKAAAALIELPEVKDGKDAEPVDLEAVAKLVQLPEPEKVDVEAIARAAAALIPAPVIPEPEHGRDAIDLEILPSIDETKQYPRGTYAAHRGGLWKSYERTHGMRGWECIVDGVDAVNVVQDGDREFSVSLAKSSGVEVVQKFALPIQIYKGVHREGEAYDAHDNVTWAGSQWTSTKAQNTDKPGTSDAWVLCVKAGRNGKDLRENASTFDASKGVKLP